MTTSLTTTPGSTYKSTTTTNDNEFDSTQPHPLDNSEAFEEFFLRLEDRPIFIITRSQQRAKNTEAKRFSRRRGTAEEISLGTTIHEVIGQQSLEVLKFLVSYRQPRVRSQLIQRESGVTRRRCSDIMSVLESLTCTRKIGYGDYRWYGLRAACSALRNYQRRYASLLESPTVHRSQMMDVAAALIHLFQYESTTWRIKDIVSKITESSVRVSNKSCKKRVYDALAIFRALGLVGKGRDEKVGKYVAWMGVEGYERFLTKLGADDISDLSGVLESEVDEELVSADEEPETRVKMQIENSSAIEREESLDVQNNIVVSEESPLVRREVLGSQAANQKSNR